MSETALTEDGRLADDNGPGGGPTPPGSLTRQLLGSVLAHAAGYSLGAAVVLRASATIVTRGWPEVGVLGALGAWSLVASYTAAGFAGGALLGSLSGAAAAVRRVERQIRTVIERPPKDGGRLLPAVPLASLEIDYARVLDAAVDGTLGRLPVPERVRRFVRARLRAPLVDDFLDTARRSGRSEAGFAELRDWLLLRGLPYVTAPLLGPLRVWRLMTAGALTALAALPLTVAIAAGLVGARPAILGACALAAVLVTVLGTRADLRGRDPRAWRRGVLTLAAQLVAWPAAWSALWDRGIGAAWVPLVLATVLGVRWSLDQAFVRAGPALPGPRGTLPPAG